MAALHLRIFTVSPNAESIFDVIQKRTEGVENILYRQVPYVQGESEMGTVEIRYNFDSRKFYSPQFDETGESLSWDSIEGARTWIKEFLEIHFDEE